MTAGWRGTIWRRLGFQFAFLLAAVLLPLTLISMSAAYRAMDEMRARSEAALTGETMVAGAKALRMIQEARGSAALAAVMIDPYLADKARCVAVLQEFIRNNPSYAQISFVPLSGKITCSSLDQEFDISENEVFKRIVRSSRPTFWVNPASPMVKASAMGVAHPVFDTSGRYTGFITIALLHSKLDFVMGPDWRKAGLELLTYNAEGEILAATSNLADAVTILPQNRPIATLMVTKPEAFSDLSKKGEERVFSLVPLVPGELYAMGSWRGSETMSFAETLMSLPFLGPLAIWVLSLVAAWLAVEWLVNRHIRKLHSSITAFAADSRKIIAAESPAAPLEIREIVRAFSQMVEDVLRDEAELENTVHQKNALLREVNHRVKNNLQMMTSIMNLNARRITSPEALQVIAALQGRIMSLSTIHRWLYESRDVGRISAVDLLGAIARQAAQVGFKPERQLDLTMEIADLPLVPDQAVPLALLTGEGLILAGAMARNEAGRGVAVTLRLRMEAGGMAVLEIDLPAEDLVPEPEQDENVAFSKQLMAVFAMQFDGQVAYRIDERMARTSVSFHLQGEVKNEPEGATGAEVKLLDDRAKAERRAVQPSGTARKSG